MKLINFVNLRIIKQKDFIEAMQTSQSFSQHYSEQFEQNEHMEREYGDNEKADQIAIAFTVQNRRLSDQSDFGADKNLKIGLQGRQTQQTTSPSINQNTVNVKNRFLLPKRPSQPIGSHNFDRKQLLQKITSNSQTVNQPQQKLPNLGQTDSANQENEFKRSKVNNYRRSLHIVMSDKKIEDSKNPQEYLLVNNKKKSISSQINSERRYHDEEQEFSKNDIIGGFVGASIGSGLQRQALIRRMRQKMRQQSNGLLKQPRTRSQNKSLNQISIKDEAIYKQPEHNSQRTIVFIKTYILSPFQSISLEISVLNGSIIVVGKLLGQEIDTLKLVLNQEKSEKLLAQSFYDWKIVGKRIFVEANESGVKQLRITPIKSILSTMIKQQQSTQLEENASISLNLNKSKQKNLLFIKQTQFIQRNYYSLIGKNDQTLNTKQNSATNSINPSSQNTINHNQNNSTEKKQQSSPSIDIKEHLARQNKHLDYLSPQIRQKAQQFQKYKDKEKSLTKQKIEKQLQYRQAFIKRQQEQIQRLSKPKQTLKSKSKKNLHKNINQKHQKSVSKEKTNFRPINRKILQKQLQIPNSINIQEAQSRINIKMTHLQQAQKINNYQINQIQDIKPRSVRPGEIITKNQQLPQDWKELNLQKTQSINHIKIQDSNSEDKYSQFQSQTLKLNQERSKNALTNMSKNVKQKIKASNRNPSQKDYEQDDFQSQPVSTERNHPKEREATAIFSKTDLHPTQSKVLELIPLAVSNQETIEKQKQKDLLEEEDDEALIRDIDQDQYGDSFEQFKEGKPSRKSLNKISHQQSKLNERPYNRQATNKSSIYDDQFQEQRYQQKSFSKTQEQKIAKSKSQDDYQQDYENQKESSYENIIEENDMLDDNQIINKIQEDYLDEDFDQ